MSEVIDARFDPKLPTTGMVTQTVTVSPDLARTWLDTMLSQRRVRRAKVDQLRRQIVEGRWKILPNGITFDRDGALIDGQHRLLAACEAGRTVVMRVTFGAEPGLKVDIDSASSPKTIEDVLRQEGVPGGLCSLLPQPVRMLFRAKAGASLLSKDLMPTAGEALDTFRAHPRLADAGRMAEGVRVAQSRSLLAYFVYRGLLVDQELTELFVEQVEVGEMLRRGDPTLTLRETWLHQRMSRVRPKLSHDAAMIAHALNAVLAGRKLAGWKGVDLARIPEIAKPGGGEAS